MNLMRRLLIGMGTALLFMHIGDKYCHKSGKSTIYMENIAFLPETRSIHGLNSTTMIIEELLKR
jgi:isocitrate dehydrogenase kinase/phosphatase